MAVQLVKLDQAVALAAPKLGDDVVADLRGFVAAHDQARDTDRPRAACH
jgi:hypothetical protein